MSDSTQAETARAVPGLSESLASVTQAVRALRSYATTISLAMLSVASLCGAVTLLIYLRAPAQRTISQQFRLNFRGASDGLLPNGARFSSSEIVSGPILLKVFTADGLSRFTSYEKFSRSFFVLQTNSAYERLVAEYEARLSDTRLSPADRDRLYQELEFKKAGVSKNTYALCYLPVQRSDGLPATVARKVLLDILNAWAEAAINEQHALDYRVPVLAPRILDAAPAMNEEPVIAIQVLRSRINRVIDNVDRLRQMPAADLVRTGDGASLDEIRLRLADTVRFRLEPLVGVASDSGLVLNPLTTTQFLESQLAYDQRRLNAAEVRVEAAREAMAISIDSHQRTEALDTPEGDAPTRSSRASETVMPQITETFLDRLIGLTRQVVDSPYRQKLIEDYQMAVANTIPAQEAVTYQSEVLKRIRTGTTKRRHADEAAVRFKLQSATTEARRLIGQVGEIHASLSRTMNPSTQLFSLNGPAVERVERATSTRRLLLSCAFVLFITFPLVVAFALFHHRAKMETAEASLARGRR